MFKSLTWSKFTLLLIGVILFWSMLNIKLWDQEVQGHRQVIHSDVVHYYSYLPAAFIHHDLTFRFVDDSLKDYRGESKFWPVEVDGSENYVVKMTSGMSIMYMPFFCIAHIIANISDFYESDGFSPIYELLIVIGCVFYIWIGFCFLRLILLEHYSEVISALVMITVLIGTNLYYYASSEPALGHGVLFMFYAMFVWSIKQWFKLQKIKHAIFIGIAYGFICLIRPVDALVILFPLLYQINKWADFRARIQMLLSNYRYLIIATSCGFLVVLPQLIFWKFNTGSWIYYSYSEEGFFFSNPQILKGLFSYRKGWLLYTPVMVFALIGIGQLVMRKQSFGLFLCIYVPLHIYVIFSWWCWWYGGSFGCRPMIELYALLAIPLGEFIKWSLTKKIIFKSSIGCILLFLVVLNIMQTAQRRNVVIHWDSMTKASYWHNFMLIKAQPGLQDKFNAPDYDAALKGLPE